MSTQETEEQRRERAQEIRRRKELIRQRRRKKKLIRLAVYALVAFLALLLILAIASIGRRIRENKATRAAEAALRQEIEQSDFYHPAEVLHLSFPVLTLDDAPAPAPQEGTEEDLHAEEGDESSEDAEGEEAEDTEDTEARQESSDGGNAEEGNEKAPDASARALTVSDFKKILQDLYDRGYVLVDLYDLAESTEEGFRAAEVMVPSGKKPLILSQQGLAYSADYDGRADALIRDANGMVISSYRNAQGVRQQGAADVVPVLEDFLISHPDFSYKGARGILGVTGENGLLGYQIVKEDYVITTIEIEPAAGAPQGTGTGSGDADAVDPEEDDAYTEEEDAYTEEGEEDTEARATVRPPEVNAAAYTQDKPEETPAAGKGTNAVAGSTASDRIITENKETIQTILGALRASGWHIASSGFGDVSYGSMAEVMRSDAEEWQHVVGPIVGTTDVLLLPGKSDIGSWSGYEENDARYQLLSGQGFRYYCAENEGELTWAQIRPGYVRLGMHLIESYDVYAALMND